MSYTSEAIRNISLIGHGASGKTTLVEALLLHNKAINSAGTIERGNTVCDFDPLEKSHQHSLDLAAVHLTHHDKHINILDTPGFPDFIGPAISSLAAVETAAMVINAQTGIETITRRLMPLAAEQDLCRMIIINKIDAENINLEQLVEHIQSTFGSECLPINLPTGNGTDVVDCFGESDAVSDFSNVTDAHTALLDQVVELDEELMEKYLEGEAVEPAQLGNTFKQALREGHLIPICFVSAHTGAGLKALLDIWTDLLPSPSEGNPRSFLQNGEPYSPGQSADEHIIANVFKVSIDPFVGKLALFRIQQGTISKDSQLLIDDGRKPFKVGHLLRIQGKDTSEMEQGVPGDICAVAKVDDIHRGAILHDSHDEDSLNSAPLPYPAPLFGLAIAVKTRGDEGKMSDTLNKLVEEDPCLAVEHNQSTAETVLKGLSDLHLRIALEKMQERYHLEVDTRPPKIAYRETIAVTAEGHHRHKKQTGGAGQFGEVFLRVEPLEQGEGFEFKTEVVGGSIPTPLLPAVEKGVREALHHGAIAGYPMHDVKAIATDGKHHPVDSKEIAFVTAGREAFVDAVRKAKPQILEPIVNIEVLVPAEAMGSITGDLSGRRGRVSGTETQPGGMMTIGGQVPLAEIDGYQSQLTSITGGAGSYTIEFSHYEPVPGDIQKKLIDEHQKQQQQSH